MFRRALIFFITVTSLSVCSRVQAQTIWTGPTITFTKAAGTDPTMAANQDRITDNVWITRGINQGIYNAKIEGAYSSFSSPADTEWAFPFNNPLASPADLTATNWAALTFDDWESAFGSSGQGGPASTINQPAVLHLISDNIYLNIKFLAPWGGNGDAEFTYERSTAVPEPASLAVIGLGLIMASCLSSRSMRIEGV